MNDRIIYDFAEIDSAEEFVVHLAALDDEVSVLDLANLFNVPTAQIVAALDLPGNVAAARRVYADLHRGLGGVLPAGSLPMLEDTVIPALDELEEGEIGDWLRTIHAAMGGSTTWSWYLPAQDFRLPLTAPLESALGSLTAVTMQNGAPYALGDVLSDPATLDRLHDAVNALESAMLAKYADLESGGSGASFLAGIDLANSLLRFQDRHWWSEERSGRISAEDAKAQMDALVPLQTELDALGEAAWKDFEDATLRDERRASRGLLDLFEDAAVHALIECAFTRPDSIAPEIREEAIATTMRGCTALAQSCEAGEFTERHLVDFFEEAGKDLSRAAEEVLRTDGGEVGRRCLEEWDYAIAALRKGVTTRAHAPSPLASLARGIREYRLALSGIGGMLEQGVVAQLLVMLRRGRELGSPLGQVGWSLATLVLRTLAANAVQHRASGTELVIAGVPQLRKVVRELAAIDALARKDLPHLSTFAKRQAFWAEQGDRLKKLQIRPVPRSLEGASTRLSITLLAICLSIHDVADAPDQAANWLFLAANVLNLAEHGWRASEFLYSRVPTGFSEALKFDQAVKLLAGLASLISGVGSVFRASDLQRRGMRFAASLEYANAASAFAVGVGQSCMGFWFLKGARAAWALRAGALLNIWGVALAVGVLLVRIVIGDDSSKGVRPVLRGVLQFLRDTPCPSIGADTLARLGSVIDACDDCRAFSILHKYGGERTDDPRGGSPTYWKAANVGLSRSAIMMLFDATKFEIWQVEGLDAFLGNMEESTGEQ